MRILVLVDGRHSTAVLDAVAKLLPLEDAEVLLAYVGGSGPRAGLDLVRQRPGARPMPPHREQDLRDAEVSAGAEAIARAHAAARAYATAIESIQLGGEPGPAICDLADRREADLVVVHVGGPDRPPIGPKSLGPAARFIADHCSRPVLLLRTL